MHIWSKYILVDGHVILQILTRREVGSLRHVFGDGTCSRVKIKHVRHLADTFTKASLKALHSLLFATFVQAHRALIALFALPVAQAITRATSLIASTVRTAVQFAARFLLLWPWFNLVQRTGDGLALCGEQRQAESAKIHEHPDTLIKQHLFHFVAHLQISLICSLAWNDGSGTLIVYLFRDLHVSGSHRAGTRLAVRSLSNNRKLVGHLFAAFHRVPCIHIVCMCAMVENAVRNSTFIFALSVVIKRKSIVSPHLAADRFVIGSFHVTGSTK